MNINEIFEKSKNRYFTENCNKCFFYQVHLEEKPKCVSIDCHLNYLNQHNYDNKFEIDGIIFCRHFKKNEDTK